MVDSRITLSKHSDGEQHVTYTLRWHRVKGLEHQCSVTVASMDSTAFVAAYLTISVKNYFDIEKFQLEKILLGMITMLESQRPIIAKSDPKDDDNG